MIDRTLARRPLGKTGLAVTEIGFGGAPVGNLYQALEDGQARAAIDAAWAAGVRYFDTAPYYGFGLSERRIGDALRQCERADFVLSSKVGRLLVPAAGVFGDEERHGFYSAVPFRPVFDYSYRGVMRSFEESLQRLGLARIDVLLIHDIGVATHGEKHEALFRLCMEGGYRALDELRTQGRVGAVGLGVNEHEVCEAAMQCGRFDCFLLAGRYTLLEQQLLGTFMQSCARHGATIIVGGVYNSGILATGTRHDGPAYYNYAPASAAVIDRVRCLEEVCEEFGVTLASAALQFPLAHPLVSSVIPGIGSIQQVEQAMRALRENIPQAFWAALKSRGLLRKDAPTADEQRGG